MNKILKIIFIVIGTIIGIFILGWTALYFWISHTLSIPLEEPEAVTIPAQTFLRP